MFRLLKSWVRDRFFASTDDIRFFQTERVLAGRSAEERLEFWREMARWLDSDLGKVFMAIQQAEYLRIQQELIAVKDPAASGNLVAAFKQQNYVISFDIQVRERIARLEKKTAKA